MKFEDDLDIFKHLCTKIFLNETDINNLLKTLNKEEKSSMPVIVDECQLLTGILYNKCISTEDLNAEIENLSYTSENYCKSSITPVLTTFQRRSIHLVLTGTGINVNEINERIISSFSKPEPIERFIYQFGNFLQFEEFKRYVELYLPNHFSSTDLNKLHGE